MKTLPDQKTLLTLLDNLKNAEQQAREICEMSTEIALKYQQKIQEMRERKSKSEQNKKLPKAAASAIRMIKETLA